MTSEKSEAERLVLRFGGVELAKRSVEVRLKRNKDKKVIEYLLGVLAEIEKL
jgi:hypothetical protein